MHIVAITSKPASACAYIHINSSYIIVKHFFFSFQDCCIKFSIWCWYVTSLCEQTGKCVRVLKQGIYHFLYWYLLLSGEVKDGIVFTSALIILGGLTRLKRYSYGKKRGSKTYLFDNLDFNQILLWVYTVQIQTWRVRTPVSVWSTTTWCPLPQSTSSSSWLEWLPAWWRCGPS